MRRNVLQIPFSEIRGKEDNSIAVILMRQLCSLLFIMTFDCIVYTI